MKRIAIFVDGSNFKAACNVVGIRPDYDKLKKYFEKEGDVVGAYYFTAMPPRTVESHLRTLTDRLQYNGWSVVSKETKTITDGRDIRYKGNVDGEIHVQAFKMYEYITDLVLCTGDGDFCALVDELQSRACRVTAVSVLRRDEQNMMDDKFRKTVTRFVNLADIAPEISLDPVVPTGLQFFRRTGA